MRPIGTLCRAVLVVVPVSLLLGAGCADTRGDEHVAQSSARASVSAPPTSSSSSSSLDVKRSLAVIDLPTLAATNEIGAQRFSLKRVLERLASSGGLLPWDGAAGLYKRIFDTNNTKALGLVADGQHCDDERDPEGNPALNGSPIQCPRQESVLADLSQHNPFCSGAGCDPYSPIAIINRFEMAPPDGRTCGQYRIVFGKGTGGETPVAIAGNKVPFDRNLIVFEAVLPNPQLELGLEGCAPVVEFWAGLSAMNSPIERGRALDAFFFDGLPGFEPAIQLSHYTGAVDPQTGVQLSGQIRANQFMFTVGQQAWQLREYNLEQACTSHLSCSTRVKMVTTKLNPSASLFDDSDTSAAALAFRDPYNPGGFLGQVEQLASADLNLINMNTLSPRFNGGQSTSSPTFNTPPLDDTNYNVFFKPDGAFAERIQTKLDGMGSALTPTEIVRRAQTQACAGCHELATSTASTCGGALDSDQLGGGLVWPDAAQGSLVTGFLPAFSQTSEVNLRPIDPESGVTCDKSCTANPGTCQCEWVVSAALTDVFLPFRRDHMAAFLASLPQSAPQAPPQVPIGCSPIGCSY